MKKAFQISIGGAVFTLEDDAYARLDGYLNAIKAHFAATAERDEIIRDIESRIAEQLAETGHAVISIADVEAVIASMGRIEDFGGEARTEEARQKKLYRSSDDVIIAGVCSGLAAYLGIDAVWVRIAFVILAFSTGLTILAYIILWIIVPQAKSASQKLEMSGSPVNIETLSEGVKEKVQEVREKHGSTFMKVLRAPFTFLARISRLVSRRLFPVIKGIIGCAFALVSLAGILALSFVAPLVLIDADTYSGLPVSEILTTPLLAAAVIGIYFSVAIPLSALFILSIDMMRKKAIMNAPLAFTLLFIWCAALVGGSVAGFVSADRIEGYSRTHQLFERETRDITISGDARSLRVQSGIRLMLIQGETPSLSVSGSTRGLEDFKAIEEDGTITLQRLSSSPFCFFCDFGSVEATLTLPSLESMSIEHGSAATAESWTSTLPLSILVKHGSGAEISITAPEVSVTALHGSRVTLRGTTSLADLSAEHGSRINATDMTAGRTETQSLHGSSIEQPDGDVI